MRKILGLIIAVGFIPAAPAFAYLDPGTGSIIVQGILAAITATAVTLGLYWQRIKTFFTGRSPSSEQEADQDLSEGPADK